MKMILRKTLILPILALCMGGCMKGEKEILSVTEYSISLDALQTTPHTFTIAANFLWSIECAATWLNFSPSKAYGDRDIEIHVSPNTSLEGRQASFFIVGEQKREEIKVLQKGEDPAIVLREETRTTTSAGGEIEVVFDTNVELDATSDVSWITRITTKLMGTNSYFFKVEPNTSLSSRTGKITLKQRNGQLSKVYTVTQMGEAPEIVVSHSSLAFDAEGGVKGVEVTSNVPWKVTVDPAKTWVKAVEGVETKLMETASCFFLAEENPRAEVREATVVISREGSTDLNRILTITQAPATPTIVFTPESTGNVSAAGTTPSTQKLTINVDANFLWSVDFSETASWITDIDFDAAKCTFKVSPNETVSERATQIVFKQIDGTFSKAYHISQAGAEAEIKVVYPVPDIKAIPESVFIFISANVPWEFSWDHSWLEVTRGATTGAEYLRCEATENTSSTPREAKITLVSEKTSLTITIKQLAGEPHISLSAESMDIPSAETTKELTITANIGWTTSVTENWIVVKRAPETKAPLSDSTVLVTIAKNTSLLPRTGIITVKQINGTLQKAVHIYQEGASPSYTITPSENKHTIGGVGDNLTLIIDANFPVSFVRVDAPSWVDYQGANPDGRRFNFTIKPTTYLEYRTAQITFKGTDSDYEFDYTVIQKGATISSADSLVLIRMYTSLSGFAWRDKWNLGDPVSQWFGITLSNVIQESDPIGKPGERLVTGIVLSSNALFGSLEGGGLLGNRVPLENLAFLQKLDLSGNLGLGGVLPENLGKLKYLRELDLSNCSFVNTGAGKNIPEAWGGTLDGTIPCFSQLTTLKLNNNALSGEIPAAISHHINWSVWNANQNILPQRGGALTLPPP